jgi:hypothetical protein
MSLQVRAFCKTLTTDCTRLRLNFTVGPYMPVQIAIARKLFATSVTYIRLMHNVQAYNRLMRTPIVALGRLTTMLSLKMIFQETNILETFSTNMAQKLITNSMQFSVSLEIRYTSKSKATLSTFVFQFQGQIYYFCVMLLHVHAKHKWITKALFT